MKTGTQAPKDLQVPTGYGPVTYFATRYTQGGRTVFSIDLSVSDIVDQMMRPDPDRPLEANRRIRPAHARGFARYIREEPAWTSPPLLLRAPPGVFEFEPIDLGLEGTQWGYLTVARHARDELAIVDGQHRTLGIHIAWEELVLDIRNARERLAKAKSNGEVAEVVRAHERKVAELLAVRERFHTERLTIQIVLESDPKAYKQIFFDIADHAKGITHSVKSRFDSRKVVNRCIDVVMGHALLEGNVDIDQDRITGGNPNLMSAKHVADIIRTLEVGISGRISRRLESELSEEHLEKQAIEFFDLIVEAFPDLAMVRDGKVGAHELRTRSLLGSVTIQRIIAGVYHNLIRGVNGAPKLKRREVLKFLSNLDMQAPIDPDGRWMATDLFPEPYMTPVARRQETYRLVDHICEWAKEAA